jgi:hypothetical protein
VTGPLTSAPVQMAASTAISRLTAAERRSGEALDAVAVLGEQGRNHLIGWLVEYVARTEDGFRWALRGVESARKVEGEAASARNAEAGR